MKIGLIDVDGHNFPNLPLMKISAWHRAQGDTVEWYEPMFSGHMDKVYMSKVFSFTPDYDYYIDADEVVKGGSGYCISLVDEKEEFDKSKHFDLPDETEHIYPDYSIYYDKIPEVRDTAYGFLTRGCPCDCDFCHVAQKEGKCAAKVANLSEFWNGQKNIVLLDPNITACRDWKELFQQLIDSKAWVDFSQGLRIHMMTEEKAEMLKQMKKTPFNIVILSIVITCMVAFSVFSVSFSTIFYILISGAVGLFVYLIGSLRGRKEADK